MRYLLDTHYLIWSLMDPDKIESREREILLDPDSIKHVSKISYWEIALKYSLGKLHLSGVTPEKILETSVAAGFVILDLSEEDLITSYKLPPSRKHRDPFDRLLVWQCIRNDLVFMTSDRIVREYSTYGLKLIKQR